MMTSAQFYLAIGLPIFSILLVWLGSTVANNRAIGALGQRIDDLHSEMRSGRSEMRPALDDLRSEMRSALDDLRSEMRSGRSEMRSALDDLRSEMKTGFEAVNQRLDRLETRFDRIEDEVRKDHESRLSRLEARVFTRTA